MVSEALYWVFGARFLVGLNVAKVPAKVTVPGTGVVPCSSVKLIVFIARGFNNWLKFATILALVVTWVAPLAGNVEITAGGVPVAVLVNVQVTAWPAATVTAAGVPLVQTAQV